MTAAPFSKSKITPRRRAAVTSGKRRPWSSRMLFGGGAWVPVAAVRPLAADHLCYARTSSGDWKIAAIDQASQ